MLYLLDKLSIRINKLKLALRSLAIYSLESLMHDSRHQAMISPLRLETVEIFNSKKTRYRIYSIRAATYSTGRGRNIWHENPNLSELTIAEGWV